MRSTRGRPSADKEVALTDAVNASTQVNKQHIDHNDGEGKNRSTRRVTRNRPIVSKEMDTTRHRGAEGALPQVNKGDLDHDGDKEKNPYTLRSTENRAPKVED